MADEQVTIEIRGIDNASGPIGAVSGALSNMATIAGGLIAFRTLEKIASFLWDIGKQAAEAYEWFDLIRFSIEELARAEALVGLEDDIPVGAVEYMEALGGAKEQAAELMDWIIKLSLASPFTAEDVNEMFRLTRAYGFQTEEAQALTEQIMDFAAATGFGSTVLSRLGLALGQIRQRGRLAGEEIRQLINVGIPVRDIVAEAFNVTTAELESMIRKGLVPAEPALAAIVEWMQRFDGASERAVKTWWGLTANFKDVKDLNMIRVFEGLATALQPGLDSLFDFFTSEEFMDSMTRLGENLGEFLTPLVELIPDAHTQLVDILNIIELAGKGTFSPGGAVGAILFELGLLEAKDVAPFADKVNAIYDTFDHLKEGITNLVEVWIGPIVDDLPLWLEDIGTIASDGIASFIPHWDHFIESMTTISESAAPFVIQNITDTLQNLQEWWAGGASEDASQIAEFLLTLAGSGAVGGMAMLTTTLAALSDVLTGKDPAPRLAALKDILEGMSEELTETEMFQRFAESISQLGVIGGVTYEQMAFEQGDSIAGGLLDGMTNGLYSGVDEAAATIAANLQAGYTDPAKVWASLTGEQQMYAAGSALAGALGQGMYDEIAEDKAELEKLLQSIIDMINRMYKIHSPSRVMADIGKKIGQGLYVGVEEESGNIMSVFRGINRRISAEMGDVVVNATSLQMPVGDMPRAMAAPPIIVQAPAPAPADGNGRPGMYIHEVNINRELTGRAFGQAFEEYTGVR